MILASFKITGWTSFRGPSEAVVASNDFLVCCRNWSEWMEWRRKTLEEWNGCYPEELESVFTGKFLRDAGEGI